MTPTDRIAKISASHRRVCKKCGESKPIKDFVVTRSLRGEQWREWRCWTCKACHSKAMYEARLERKRKRAEADAAPLQVPGPAPTLGVYCSVCYGMSWRVRGPRCKCGLDYAPEPPIELSAFSRDDDRFVGFP